MGPSDASVAPADAASPTQIARARRLSYLSLALSVVTVDERFGMRPLLVLGQLYFRTPLDLTKLRKLLTKRLCPLPRFSAVVVDRGSQVRFDPIPIATMDMWYHVVELPVEDTSPWTSSKLDGFLSSLNTPEYGLDATRPLWRFFYIPKLADGRSLLVPVINHAIGDGVALVSALLSITDDAPSTFTAFVPSSQAVARAASPAPPPAPSPTLPPAPPPARRAAAPPASLGTRVCAALMGCVEATLGPVLPADPPSRLKLRDHRNPPHARVCAQSEQVPLEMIKEIKNAFEGVTVNDVLLALMTMTLRRYHEEAGSPLPRRMRGIFPISLRDSSDSPACATMGNQFGNGVFSFPTDYADPAALVRAVKRQLDAIKASPKPYIERALFSAVLPPLMTHGQCLRNVTRNLLLDVYGKATALLSNVPGPQSQAWLCGEALDDLMFYSFVPLGVYIGVISYNGKVSTGICCVPECESDAALIARHWKPAVEELLAAARATTRARAEGQ